MLSLSHWILFSWNPARSIQELRLWEEDGHSPTGLQYCLLTWPPLLRSPWWDQAQHPAASRDNQVKSRQLSVSQLIRALGKENIDNHNDICVPATGQAWHPLLAKMIPNESPEHPGWCAPATDACNAKYGYTQLVSPDVNLWPPLSGDFPSAW